MQIDQLYQLLDQIPGYEYAPKFDGSWVSVPCIMAPVRHSSGRDRNPSMSISVGDEASVAFCHSCNYSRQFQNALVDMFRQNVYPNIGHLALIAQRAEVDSSDNPFKAFGKPKDKLRHIKNTDFTEALYEIEGQPWSSDAETFLESRGVSVETAKAFHCEFLPAGFEHESFVDKDGDVSPIRSDGILLPTIIQRDGKSICVGAQFRPLVTGMMKYVTPWRFSSSYYFFGQQFAPFFADRPIALVEGGFDVMHLYQERLPSLSLNGLSLQEIRLELLTSFNPSSILLLLDPDGPGQAAQDRLGTILDRAKTLHASVQCPKDPKHLSKNQLISLHPLIAAHYQC